MKKLLLLLVLSIAALSCEKYDEECDVIYVEYIEYKSTGETYIAGSSEVKKTNYNIGDEYHYFIQDIICE